MTQYVCACAHKRMPVCVLTVNECEDNEFFSFHFKMKYNSEDTLHYHGFQFMTPLRPLFWQSSRLGR